MLEEVILLGFVRGTLYALLVVGFALILSVGRVINLAHGAYYMMGAYFSYIAVNQLFGGSEARAATVLALLVAVILAGLVGLFQFFVLLRSLRRPLHDYILAMSLGLALFAGEVFRQLYGVHRANAPALLRGNTEIMGVRIINQELLIVPIAIVVISLLLAYLKFGRGGRAILAVAQNREGAVLVGVEPTRVMAVVMFLAAALAALAGGLIAPVREVDPLMWIAPLIKSFAIVIVGGLGSTYGALVAAYILGAAEVGIGLRWGAQYTDLVSLILIVLILITRPRGLFGKEIKL